jgi:prepilin-type N-terminal cleavage/methylation domain-containing protein
VRLTRRHGGFTFVECLTATVILGIGVVGVASMFTYASMSQRKASYMARAREIADGAMEEARISPDSFCPGNSGNRAIPTPNLPRSSGTMAWQIHPSESTDSELKLVTVNLVWSWPATTSGKYVVTTLIPRQEDLSP